MNLNLISQEKPKALEIKTNKKTYEIIKIFLKIVLY